MPEHSFEQIVYKKGNLPKQNNADTYTVIGIRGNRSLVLGFVGKITTRTWLVSGLLPERGVPKTHGNLKSVKAAVEECNRQGRFGIYE